MSNRHPSRVVAVIPARYASQRLPGKPLALINGKPMICRVAERVRQAALVDDVIVATDDRRIAEAVEASGITAVMTPVDVRSGSDRIAIVAATLPETEIIVNVQGDEPLLPPAMVDEAVQPLLEDDSIVAGTLVRRIASEEELLSPSIPKVVLDREGFCLYFSRSVVPFVRDCPAPEWMRKHTFYRHIGLYVFRRDFLLRFASMEQTPLEMAENLEQLRILEHGFKIKAVVTEHDSIAVDTPEDLARVQLIVERHS